MEDNPQFSKEFLDEMYKAICSFYKIQHRDFPETNKQKAEIISNMRKPHTSLSGSAKEISDYVQGEIVASNFIAKMETSMFKGEIDFDEFAECVNKCGGFPIYFTEAMLKLLSRKEGA